MPFPTDPQPEVPLQDPDPPEIQEPSGVTGSTGESSPHPPDQLRTSESQETRTAAATTSSTTPSTTTTTAAATGNRNAGLTNVCTLLEGIHVLTAYTINAQKIEATELLLMYIFSMCCVCICVTFS